VADIRLWRSAEPTRTAGSLHPSHYASAARDFPCVLLWRGPCTLDITRKKTALGEQEHIACNLPECRHFCSTQCCLTTLDPQNGDCDASVRADDRRHAGERRPSVRPAGALPMRRSVLASASGRPRAAGAAAAPAGAGSDERHRSRRAPQRLTVSTSPGFAPSFSVMPELSSRTYCAGP